jgi:drug/metabolite transporter (DMT)-like permease
MNDRQAYATLLQIVRTIVAGRAVTFLNLMPFAVLTLAWLLVGETINATHVIGALLVAAGVYLATRPA